MEHEARHNGEMTGADAAETIARRLDEHEERLARLATQFAGLQRARNDIQDLRAEVSATAVGGLAAAIGAIATRGQTPTAHQEAIARTAHEVATAALASVPEHGDVTAAGIGLRHEDGWLTVVVGDNGSDSDSAETASTFQRLEARVTSLDGHLFRVSTLGEGTTLVVGLPSRRAG